MRNHHVNAIYIKIPALFSLQTKLGILVYDFVIVFDFLYLLKMFSLT